MILDAPEKKDGGKGGKKKRKGATEDVSRGGVDGGLKYLTVLPYPLAAVREVGRDNNGLRIHATLCPVSLIADG